MSTYDPLALQRRLAGLAVLEANVRTVLHALRATYPKATCPHPEDKAFEISSAHLLADLGDDLLVALDDHRAHLRARLTQQQHPEQIAWPF